MYSYHDWSRTSPSSDLYSRTGSQHSKSNTSYQSHSTAPAEHSYRPRLRQWETCYPRLEGGSQYDNEAQQYDDARSSVETYASTVPSEEDLMEEVPPFEAPDYENYQPCGSNAIPATPRDFSELFPSTQRLSIRHDDATVDGNMNLRVDTEIETRSGTKRPMTLFHLRMNDLRSREFSLRRYCRDSGREVCHSLRKYQKPAAEKRPGLQKSFSSAFWNLRHKTPSASSQLEALKRSDSGYGSMFTTQDYGEEDEDESPEAPSASSRKTSLLPTNTIKLEFSNYAHLDVKRRGAGASKRYEFEYWGVQYTWRRTAMRNGDFEEVSYHLYGSGGRYFGQIVPVTLTSSQAREESAKGGWVPPCYLWLTEETVASGLSDFPDVVVSTGLMALVDDCVKRRWHSKRRRQIPIPLSRSGSLRMNMEYVGPKKLIDEVFNRSNRKQPTARLRTSVEA